MLNLNHACRDAASERVSSKTVEKAGWGVLLIWIGLALLLDVGWGVGLTGAGIIALAAQGIRRYTGARWDGFAVAVGALLVVGGASSILGVTIPLVPLLCIAAGIVILASTWGRRTPRAPGSGAEVDAPSHGRA